MGVRKTRVEEGGGKKRESERELLSERDAQRNKNNGKRQHAREQSNSSSYDTSSVFFTLSFLSGSISLLSHYYIFALFRSFFISIHFFPLSLFCSPCAVVESGFGATVPIVRVCAISRHRDCTTMAPRHRSPAAGWHNTVKKKRE